MKSPMRLVRLVRFKGTTVVDFVVLSGWNDATAI
jgi:hypothetical protein